MDIGGGPSMTYWGPRDSMALPVASNQIRSNLASKMTPMSICIPCHSSMIGPTYRTSPLHRTIDHSPDMRTVIRRHFHRDMTVSELGQKPPSGDFRPSPSGTMSYLCVMAASSLLGLATSRSKFLKFGIRWRRAFRGRTTLKRATLLVSTCIFVSLWFLSTYFICDYSNIG